MYEELSRTSVEYLKDTFKIGYEAYEDSRIESTVTWNMYHNRQYTAAQLAVLHFRGQPAETFNVIKLFSRLLIGYYSTVVNSMTALPVGIEDIPTTSLLNDIIDHVLRDNNFYEEGEKAKLSGLISGLMCIYINVQDTGKKDSFGRSINKIILEHVPESELILDPMSRKEDYSDARFIHRFKWLSEEAIIATFGKKKMQEMQEYFNYTYMPDADYDKDKTQNTKGYFSGLYKIYNNYLIVHSIIIDEKGKSWSIFWHDEIILEKKELTHKEVPFPYRITLTHYSEQSEYYGIFHEILESQKAINQALIKLQLLVNTQKVYVEEGAVSNVLDFTNAVNRVTAVIPVISLAGIKVQDLAREALEQYQIIDKAFDRIQRVLGINDSFLGMAFASDSGRKVKLQQNASIIALRYFTSKVETFYRFIGWDIAKLIKQYYTATQALRIADDDVGHRWAQLNQPMQTWTGENDPQTGEPIMEFTYEEVLDPATNEPLIDEEGNYIIAPIPTKESEIAFTNVDMEITSTAYNDEDEKNQLMLETVLNGPVGQFMMQVNPAGFLKASGLSLQSVKTKNSPEIAKIFEETAMMLGGNPEAQQQAQGMAQGIPGQAGQQPKSQELKLPQNTNEGL